MSEQVSVWVLEVGGGLRGVYTSPVVASAAFDAAYRPDVSRTLTRVIVDPAMDEDANSLFQDQRYRVKFAQGLIKEVHLWREGDMAIRSARYRDGGGDVMIAARGAYAAMEAAMMAFGAFPEED